ncbi:MAG TPA: hypothetical protein VFH83_06870 [Spirochaetia bacterium]|nr:hypothetical protein [Spirochaetia bacterium]
MRKGLVLAVVLMALGAAAAFAFSSDELNKITFVNSTGSDIETLFLSPGDSDHWGPDIIGADSVLANGDSLGFYVHYPETSFKFDIMASDTDGNTFEVYDYKLTDGKEAKITFTKKNLNTSKPDFTFATLTITNKSSHELDYLFISPEDSNAWGVDLLNEDTTLSQGDSEKVMVPIGNAKVTYNLMAADDSDREYTFDLVLDPAKGKSFKASVEDSDLNR